MILSQTSIKEREDLVEYSLIFIIGLIFGSFLNMLIYRLPLGISLISPKRSMCTNCRYLLKWYENVPVISYIYLKAKCSSCKTHISYIYPIVELITACITLLLYIKIGLSYNFILIVSLFYILILLSFIDFKYKAVPDYLLLIVLVVSFFIDSFDFKAMLLFIGAIVLLEIFITFYIQNIKAKILKDDSLKEQKALGEGDIPIVAIIGGLLGIKLGMLAIFLSAILAIIPSIINSMIKKDIETPFIPYLVLALFIVFITDSYCLQFIEQLR